MRDDGLDASDSNRRKRREGILPACFLGLVLWCSLYFTLTSPLPPTPPLRDGRQSALELPGNRVSLVLSLKWPGGYI